MISSGSLGTSIAACWYLEKSDADESETVEEAEQLGIRTRIWSISLTPLTTSVLLLEVEFDATILMLVIDALFFLLYS